MHDIPFYSLYILAFQQCIRGIFPKKKHLQVISKLFLKIEDNKAIAFLSPEEKASVGSKDSERQSHNFLFRSIIFRIATRV